MRRFLWYYNHLLHRYKYPVQIISGGVLWFTGDLISQSIEQANRSNKLDSTDANSIIDWRRIARMTTYGMIFSAPIYTFWYSFLDRITHRVFNREVAHIQHHLMKSDCQKNTLFRSFLHKLTNEGWRTWSIIGFKLAADTVLFDPAYLGLFFGITSALEGKSLGQIREKLRSEFLRTYLIDVAVWFPIQTMNFKWTPVMYQPLVVQSCNIGWNAYLSFVQHR